MTTQPDPMDALDAEASAFVSTLVNETPRGAILVSAQFADIMLARLLTAAFRSPQSAAKLLEDFNAPLGHFAARILAAYAMGIMPEELYWNLEQLRKMRNYCAHSMGPISFSDDKIKNHLDNLRIEPTIGVEESLSDDPFVRIGSLLGTLQTWCQMVTAKLDQRSHDRLPALEAEMRAAEHDKELGRVK